MDNTAAFKACVHHLRLTRGKSASASTNTSHHQPSHFLTAAVHLYRRIVQIRSLVDDGADSKKKKDRSGDASFSGDILAVVQSFSQEAVPALKVLHEILEQTDSSAKQDSKRAAALRDTISFYSGIVLFLQEQLSSVSTLSVRFFVMV
jgi:hypothetical protein